MDLKNFDYERFVKSQMFGDNYKKVYQSSSFIEALFHQLALVISYKKESNFLLESVIRFVEKAIGIEKANEIKEFFGVCKKRNVFSDMNSLHTHIFTEAVRAIFPDTNWQFILPESIGKIVEELEVTLVFLKVNSQEFQKSVIHCGTPILVLEWNEQLFFSINSIHLRSIFGKGEKFWPNVWATSQPAGLDSMKKLLKKSISYQKLDQSVFQNVSELYRKCPWLEGDLKEYIEFYVEKTSFSGYKKNRKSVKNTNFFCNYCYKKTKARDLCFSCYEKRNNFDALGAQICDTCNEKIARENQTLGYYFNEDKIYHLECSQKPR